MSATLSSSLKLLPVIFTKKIVQRICKRNYAAPKKRFYKTTGVLYNDGKYEVTLDQRKLKTPNGNLFVLDSEPLALAVATEWNSQKDKIMQSSMHLTTLCNTAIDNPNNLSKEDMVHYIVNYLPTDAILYQSLDNDELYKLQMKNWDPMIQWFCDRYQVDLQKVGSIAGPTISDKTKNVLKRHLSSYSLNAVHGKTYKKHYNNP